MSEYEMSTKQREAWKSRVQPLFARVSSSTEVARLGRFGEANLRTAAGYIGQFRDGNPRALTYFLDEPARLEMLARGLGTTAEQLKAMWSEVERHYASTADTLLLPGFEDWGPMSLDDGFVLPPVETRGRRLDEVQLRDHVLKSLDKGVSVVGPRGSGVTTLLRRLSAWAEADGWRVSWGLSSGLPTGRAALVVIDGADLGDVDAIMTWLKEPGHGALHGYDRLPPFTPRRFPEIAAVHVLPVDEAWSRALAGVATRQAPRRDAKRMRGLRQDRLHDLLARIPAPTPELAGCLVRALLDGAPADLETHGATLVVDAARRRLVGLHREEHLPVLNHGAAWVRDAYRTWSASVDGPVDEPVSDAVLDEARSILADARLTEHERGVLKAVLPLASGSGGIEALRQADVVREESGRERFRMEEFLAPSIAAEVVAAPGALRVALLARRRALLGAVARTKGGPAALAKALGGLDTPALVTALSDLVDDADWLGRVQWGPGLVAKVLAMVLVTGQCDRAFYVGRPNEDYGDGKARRRATAPLPELWEVLGAAPELPTLAAVHEQLARCAAELRVPQREISDDVLSLFLAIACPDAGRRTATTCWTALDDELFPLAGWIERVAETTDGLAFLVDPTLSPVADRVMRVKEPGAAFAGRETLAVWLALMARLFDRAPDRAVDTLAHVLRDVGRRVLGAPEDPDSADGEVSPAYSAALDRWFAWHRSTELELEAVAEAARLPTRAARARLREALRSEMAAWESANDGGPIAGWMVGRIYFARGSEPSRLSRLLGFCYETHERARFLRAPDGTLSPFWRPLLEAGVPFEDAVRLYEDVRSGALVGHAGRGAPKDSEMRLFNAVPGDESERQRLTASRIWTTIFERATPEQLASSPDFDVEIAPTDQHADFLLGFPNVRTLLWRRVADLGDASLVWKLLGYLPYGTRWSTVRLRNETGLHEDAVADLDGIVAAVRLVPGTPLPPERWNRLANAALRAGAPTADLRPLLAAEGLAAVDAPLLVEVVQRVVEADPAWGRAWLLDRLADQPTLVDARAFAGAWVASKIGPDVLAATLDASTARPKGDGLVLALVRLGRDRFAEWLADDDTRDAALGALAASADWRERLEPVLARQAHVPPPAVLAHLLAQPGGIGFEVLDSAAERWSPELRRHLWLAAAAVAVGGEHRKEVWRRLALS